MGALSRFKKSGFVLIFALWTLSFLSVLAVSIAVGVRQKIIVIDKLDERSRIHHLLDTAAAYTKADILKQLALSNFLYSPVLKNALHDNPSVFAKIAQGQDHAQVSYSSLEDGLLIERFGVVDEERKVNLNTTNPVVLQRLVERVLGMKEEDASKLTRSILDWRKWGEGNAGGFFSDEYYANLQYPYPKKDADYESIDELLLVKGIAGDVYTALLPYVTIYGEGKVNINTASAPVLFALGMSDPLITKILTVRRGDDALEDTLDDHVFQKTFDVATEVALIVALEPQEIKIIDDLNMQGAMTTDSYYFSMLLTAQLDRRSNSKKARVVFASREGRVLYWSEK